MRVRTEQLEELAELGLLDVERWRAGELGGVTLDRSRSGWVRCFPGKESAVLARYRRGARPGEWIEELLHGRKPLSAAGRQERAHEKLERAGRAGPDIVLAGEVTSRLRVERESFLVTREAVDFLPLSRRTNESETAMLRRILGDLGGRRVPAPDLSLTSSP